MRTSSPGLKAASRLAVSAAPLMLKANPAWPHVAKGIQGGFESGFIHPSWASTICSPCSRLAFWARKWRPRRLDTSRDVPDDHGRGRSSRHGGFELPYVEVGIASPSWCWTCDCSSLAGP